MNRTEDGKYQPPSVIAEGVEGAGDRWGQHVAFDDASLFEFAQALRQKICRDARNCSRKSL